MPADDFQRCRQHKISGVVHLLNDRGELSCGRSWLRNYLALFDFQESGWQTFCQQCLRLSRDERHASIRYDDKRAEVTFREGGGKSYCREMDLNVCLFYFPFSTRVN